jgi:hypothetical protein
MATQKEILEELLGEARARNAREELEAERASTQRDKADKKRTNEQAKLKNQMAKADGNLTSLPVIGRIVKGISSSISKTANQSLKLQEQALSRGMSLNFEDKLGLGQAIKHNAAVTQQLGGITGKQVGNMQAIQTNFDMFAGGLGSASYETSRLVHATRLSSGQDKQLIKQLASNTRGMGFSNEQTSRLSDTTLGMSQKFGVSTNELVNAVGGLSDQLYDFAALGIGAEIQEAATVLAAGLGPAMANVGPQIIGAFTKGESMVQAQLLGVMNERTELLKVGGDHTKAAINLVTKGGAEAERLINQWTSGGMDRGLALQQLTQIYGKETTMLLAARNELQAQAEARGMSLAAYTKAMQKEAKIKQEWTNSWQNFKDKVVSPLQEVVMSFVNFGLKLINAFGWLIKPLAQLGLGVVSLMMAVVAMRKAFLLYQAASKVGGAVKGAIAAGGGGIKGIGGAISKGLGGLKGFITGKKKAGGGGMPGPAVGGGLPAPGAPAGGAGLGGFLGNLGDGLKKLGTTGAMKGAATIAILAASLAIAAFGFGLFAGVDWSSIAKGTVALLLLTGVAMIIGKLAGQLIPGALAIALLGVSLLPLAFAFNLIKAVGIGTMFAFAGALIVLALAAAGASFIAPFIIAGAFAFGILGIALIPLAVALRIAAPAMDAFMTALIRFKDVPLLKLLGFAFVLPFLAAGMMTLALVAPGMFVLGVAMTLFIGPFMKFVIALSWFKNVPLGKILGFALMMPILAAGFAILGAVAPALFILGIAMTMFIMPFMKLIMALTWLNDVPIGKMFLLLPALMAITYGLLAMTAGGLLMAAFDGLLNLFGADSPIEKIVKMGKAAKHINKMAESLKKLPFLLKSAVREMAKIKLGPFYILAHGLGIVKKALDKLSLLDMLKFKLFGVSQAKTQATPMQPVQRRKNQFHSQAFQATPKDKGERWTPDSPGWGTKSHHQRLRDRTLGRGVFSADPRGNDPMKNMTQSKSSTTENIEGGIRTTKKSQYSIVPEGVSDLMFKSPEERPIVGQDRIGRKEAEIDFMTDKRDSSRDQRSYDMQEDTLVILRQQLGILQHVYDSQQEGNEIGAEGNHERREGNRQGRVRPTERMAGAGVEGDI